MILMEKIESKLESNLEKYKDPDKKLRFWLREKVTPDIINTIQSELRKRSLFEHIKIKFTTQANTIKMIIESSNKKLSKLTTKVSSKLPSDDQSKIPCDFPSKT